MTKRLKIIIPIAIAVLVIGVSFATWGIVAHNKNNTITTGEAKTITIDKSGSAVYFVGTEKLYPGESQQATVCVTKGSGVTNYKVTITDVLIGGIAATAANTAGLNVAIGGNAAENIAEAAAYESAAESFTIIVSMAANAEASVLANKTITFTIQVDPA